MSQLSLALRGPPNIIPTSFLLGVWLAFPYNLGVIYLHERALVATRLMFTYGLATTLGIAIYYNTAIIPESVCCTLVAFSVKYVCLLKTTLGVTIRCNTAIRLEFVYWTLMTYRHVFVYCSATTLALPFVVIQPSDRSLSAVYWQLLDFYLFVALA